jgi:ElaB/YqjD/DUF883 family membrane-anchored ribosome-binding protein
MNTHTDTMTPMTPGVATEVGERMASRTDEALNSVKRAASNTERSLQAGLDGLRDTVPGAVTRAAAQAEDLTRRGLEHARHAADEARHRAADLGDRTVHRIQDEPVKAVLIAVAAGAAATLLVQWLSRSRHHPY